MAEGTYEYECMRAELLGIEKPDYDEFLQKQKEKEVQEVQEDEVDTENLKEVEGQKEGMNRITSKLDELNSLLAATGKKINRFKTSYGSFANMLKTKVGYASSTESVNSTNGAAADQKTEEPPQEPSNLPQKKADLYDAVDNHMDKLDAMISKAETAHISMEQQRKQMNKFLK